MKALEAYALSKKFTKKSLDGVGAIEGKPCTIESITEIDGGHRITFKWTGDSGTVYTDTLDVKDGLGIKSVAIEKVEGEDHLIITYDDDTTEDAGRVSGGAVNYPELVAPSASISATSSTLLECGGVYNMAIRIAFDRGKIDPAYGTSGYRSGAATEYSLDGRTQVSGSFNVNIMEDKLNYQGFVSYAAGEQPKDSDGNDYDFPLAAGVLSTEVLKFEFVNAIWANTAHIDTVAKLPLVSKIGGETILDFPAQTLNDPEEFHLPSDWNNVKIYAQYPYSEGWEEVTSEFSVTPGGHDDASGTEVSYKKYRDNRGYAAEGRTIKITWE